MQGISKVDRVLGSASIFRPDVRRVAYLYRGGLEIDSAYSNE